MATIESREVLTLEPRVAHDYFVLKLWDDEDKLPVASRLNTWKKYCCLRASPEMEIEWFVTSVRSRLVLLP